jgi:hypothetical protein
LSPRTQAEAGRDAGELKGIPTLTYVGSRVHYFEHIGDTDAPLKELDRASRRPETSDLVAQYALTLYELGRDAEALRALDERLKPNNSTGQMLRIILYAEQFGPGQAYERYVAMARKRESHGAKASPYEIAGLMLLGKKKEAAELADSIFNQPPGTAASTSAAKLLQNAGNDRLKLCAGYFLVGREQLMDGDRAGAREHLQKSVDTKFFGHIVYPYARVFLERLKRDPKWPKWIPVKK